MEATTQGLFNGVSTQSPQPKRRGPNKVKDSLCGTDVCAILDSCLRCNVKSFSFGGLVVEFQSQVQSAIEAVREVFPSVSTQDAECQGRRDSLTALGDCVDDELEALKITNPFLYEKYMAEQGATKDESVRSCNSESPSISG